MYCVRGMVVKGQRDGLQDDQGKKQVKLRQFKDRNEWILVAIVQTNSADLIPSPGGWR